MRIDLDKVPVREADMSAYQIMLSESQERMLLVVKKGSEQKVTEIFDKWDLHSVVIGEVTDDGMVKIYKGGELKADVPAENLALGGGAPVYMRESRKPDYIENRSVLKPGSLAKPADAGKVLLKLLGNPNIASKRWVFEQYDSMVRPAPESVRISMLRLFGSMGPINS